MALHKPSIFMTHHDVLGKVPLCECGNAWDAYAYDGRGGCVSVKGKPRHRTSRRRLHWGSFFVAMIVFGLLVLGEWWAIGSLLDGAWARGAWVLWLLIDFGVFMAGVMGLFGGPKRHDAPTPDEGVDDSDDQHVDVGIEILDGRGQ